MKKQILTCILLAAITGCNGEQSVELTNKEKIANLELSGKLPALDRSADILGLDENNNGVRDDIDAYIDRAYPQPEQHAATIQNAKVLQKYMVVDITNDTELRKLLKESHRAINCAFDRFDGYPEVLDKLEAMTANTKQRLLAYLAVSKAANGMAFGLESGDTCE